VAVLSKRIQNIVFYVTVLLGIFSIGWWLTANPVKTLSVSEPGMDNRGDGSAFVQDVEIGEIYNELGSSSNQLTGKWPQFRGEDQDNISKADIDLIEKFRDTIPDIMWSVELGEGHAGAAIYNGIVYILDYDEEEEADLLRSFDLVTGKEIWQRGYHVHVKRNHGKSRTTPAVTEDYILTMGPKSHVMCVDRSDGSYRWGINLEKDYKTEVPMWYTGQCPLIDKGTAVIASCGTSLMMGVDCESGDILWETPNPKGWKMSHSSVMLMEYAGRRMYVYAAIGAAFGVSADDENAGELLWSTEEWRHDVVAASPVCMPDGKIYMSAAYGTGCMVMQLQESDGKLVPEIIDQYMPGEGLAAEQQTPIFYNGYLFSILPKYAAALRNQFVCVNPSNFRNMVWTSGKTSRFGLGPYILADGKFFILSDEGVLTIARASTREYVELDQVKVFQNGQDAWAPIAYADGYMVLRDSKTMVCISLKS
jgi:outer membrane protein assembly factor BamB